MGQVSGTERNRACWIRCGLSKLTDSTKLTESCSKSTEVAESEILPHTLPWSYAWSMVRPLSEEIGSLCFYEGCHVYLSSLIRHRNNILTNPKSLNFDVPLSMVTN
jgi:hypothetical protein